MQSCHRSRPVLEYLLWTRKAVFRDIERGDIVIGRISSIREFGFFMVLICLGSGIMRDISYEITVTHLFSLFDCLFLIKMSSQCKAICFSKAVAIKCHSADPSCRN